VDAADLQAQYSTSNNLRIRADTHRLYSEHSDPLREEVVGHLALEPDLAVLDLGCGPGGYHPAISSAGATVVGIDRSHGMLREARARAVSDGYQVGVAQADAQALPFADGLFDRVLAAHMLYHVPDREQALREMRRVLRTGGRVVLVTNGARFLGRLEQLHLDAAASLGYTPTAGDASRFTLEDLELVRSVFPSAERYVLDNALLFQDAEPALRYYASGLVERIRDRPVDGSHRERLLPLVRAGIEAIIASEGSFRDPKPTGCFVAHISCDTCAV
jgi:ubiquinone/menaquinone biosynthesis C-methylase UbiE